MEGKRKRHIVIKLLVHKLKLFVCIIDFIFLYQPYLLLKIEVFTLVTLYLVFRSTNIRDGSEVVLVEYLTYSIIFSVVDNSIESRSS